jgi:CubicO group peptidase (beta-lactamase class C family)
MPNAVQQGWSETGIAAAGEAAASMPEGCTIVVQGGRLVAIWGDASRRTKLSSIRKSFLSALFGIWAETPGLDLDRTLAEIGVDEVPPLSATERSATIRMLLQSRSGVYRPAVGGLPADRARMPAPDSHAPGTFWYYNNWDFNALGTVFERLTGSTVADAFASRIAQPLGMQDFRHEDSYSFAGGGSVIEQSRHPAYHFRMSARDAARFGLLFLSEGAWGSQRLVPAAWVRESTQAYSRVGRGGYGYLWWVDAWPGVEVPSFSARGALGKYIVVLPERDLVVVYLNHTDFPDNAADLPPEDLARLPTATGPQLGRLLSLILAAQAR